MKATLRQSGKMRFTMSVKFHFGLEQIAEAMFHELSCGHPLPTTRKQVFGVVRKLVYMFGYKADMDSDEDIGEDRQDALDAALRMFPELAPKES